MKTRDRILEASIGLFNRAGTAEVSCVDIATELGISPGNLYYHFRGKEEIQTALMAEFELALLQIYQRYQDQIETLDDFQPYVHSLLKIGHHFRFLFRDQAAFRFADKQLHQRWRRMMKQVQQLSRQLLQDLDKKQPLQLGKTQRDTLADSLLMTGLASLSSSDGVGDGSDIARQASVILNQLLSPYQPR